MDSEAVKFLRGVTILGVQIFYVGEFSFPVYWYIDPKTHQVRGKMYTDHESTALTEVSVNQLPIRASLVTTRGFDTREEFEVFARGHPVLMGYIFDWPDLEKRYGVFAEI